MSNGHEATRDARAILERAKDAIISVAHEREKTHGPYYDYLEAWRVVAGAWDYLLRMDNKCCACGNHLHFRLACNNCEPPDERAD